ncbi:MAG: tetratricopeptide repeat protein, partial [Promethearchaeota archaeon]
MWDKVFPKSFENSKIFDLGLKAYELGDFKGAVKCFKRIIEKEPDLPTGWYVLLESLFYLGKWEEMIEIGEEALKNHPNYGPNYSWLGEAYNKQGKRKKAMNCYEKGIQVLKKDLEKYPKDDNVLNLIGYNYLRLGKYKEAIKCYKETIKIRPKSEHHLHSIGQTYMKMGLFNKAIKYLEKSLEVNPKHSYAWFDLGLIYEDTNEYDKAIEYYEKAVESSPQWVKLRKKLLKLKPDSLALLKKTPDIRSLFDEGIAQQLVKSENMLNDLKELETILKDNKLTIDERKYFEQRKLKLTRELELDNVSRQDKVNQLKKLLSESSDLLHKIEKESNKSKKKDLYQRLKVLSKTVEEKR